MDELWNAIRLQDRIPTLVPMFATRRKIGKRHEVAKIRGKTYRVGGFGRLNIKLVHRGGNRLCALDQIGIYGFAICYLGVVWEAILVDDAHLFHNRGLAGLTRA